MTVNQFVMTSVQWRSTNSWWRRYNITNWLTVIVPTSSRIGWPSLYRRHHELVDRHCTDVITNWLTVIIGRLYNDGQPIRDDVGIMTVNQFVMTSVQWRSTNSWWRRYNDGQPICDDVCIMITNWFTVIIPSSSRIGWPSLYRRHHELVYHHYTVVITNWLTVIVQTSSRIGWLSL
jgi:hypothetical protein